MNKIIAVYIDGNNTTSYNNIEFILEEINSYERIITSRV